METLQSRVPSTGLAGAIQSARWVNSDKLRLFSAPTANAGNLVIGDFTEASFTGYAAVVLSGTWIAALDAAARWVNKYLAAVLFLQTATTISGTVYGWYVTDTTGATLKAYGFFDAPAVMDAVNNQIVITPFVLGTFLGNAEVELLFGP